MASPPSNRGLFLSKLPLEIRRKIYAYILPQSDLYTKGPQWLSTTLQDAFKYDDPREEKPTGCIQFLSTNRQINAEASPLLYSKGVHTVTISPGDVAPGLAFLKKQYLPTIKGDEPPIIPTAARFVTNWEIDVWRSFSVYVPNPTRPDFKLDMDFDDKTRNMCAGITFCGRLLATTRDIKSVRFKLPGHCYTRFPSWKTSVLYWFKVLQPISGISDPAKQKNHEVLTLCDASSHANFGNGQCVRHECIMVARTLQPILVSQSLRAMDEHMVHKICDLVEKSEPSKDERMAEKKRMDRDEMLALWVPGSDPVPDL